MNSKLMIFFMLMVSFNAFSNENVQIALCDAKDVDQKIEILHFVGATSEFIHVKTAENLAIDFYLEASHGNLVLKNKDEEFYAKHEKQRGLFQDKGYLKIKKHKLNGKIHFVKYSVYKDFDHETYDLELYNCQF